MLGGIKKRVYLCAQTSAYMKYIMLLLSLLAATVHAQRQVSVYLTPDGSASMKGFLPAKPTGRAVVVLPGGGYSHLALGHEGYDWAPWFNRQGIACFVVTYRMPKGDLLLPFYDASNAMLYVREHAEEWNINPHQVGIMGSSAGGHLATTVACHAPKEARPDFQILFYPVVTMQRNGTHEGSAREFLGQHRDEAVYVQRYSNELQVKPGETAPAIILAASDDTAVPVTSNGVAYYNALCKAGIPASLYLWPKGGHGFGIRRSFKYHDQMMNELQNWLKNL